MTAQFPTTLADVSLHQQPQTAQAWSDAEPASELAVGQKLGPFALRRLLGAGGMGEVYLADQLEPVQRQVALKFMRQRLAGGSAQARFEIERQALARMSHPAIAQVYEAGQTADGYPYLAMEYVPGEPIDAYCQRNQLGLARRLELFIALALGVRHAHHKGILHLDLKPANLLVMEVDGKAQPKIIDFGLAMSTVRVPGQHSRRSWAGTPGYMSPEQAGLGTDGSPAEVDIRSDVYALGVVLFQLLTDDKPFAQFSAATTEELLRELATSTPPLPSQQRLAQGNRRAAALLRGDLDAVVACAMHRERALRYESVSDLIDELRRVLEYRPVQARRGSRRHRLGLFLRRNRLPVAVAALLTLTLASGLAVAGYGLIQARQEGDVAAMRQAELEQVSAFQQSMLTGLDPAILGQSLRSTLLQQSRAGMVGDSDAEQRLAEFDRELALANPTEAARQMIDTGLLARALQAIARDLAEQPLVAAELQLAIGEAYRALGRFGSALESADAALAGYASVVGEQHPKALRAQLLRAELMNQLGRGREHLPAIEALVRAARAAGETGIALQAEIVQVVVLSIEAGRQSEAVAMAEDLYARHLAHFGEGASETLSSLQLLAALTERSGDVAAGEPLWQQVLQGRRASVGEEDPRTIEALEMLGANIARQGKHAAALPMHERALELRRRVQGNEHPQTLQSMNSVSITLASLRRMPESIAIAEAALELRTRTLGREHPSTLRSMVNLGAFYAMADDLEAAIAITRECHDIRLRVLGPDNVDSYRPAANLIDFEIAAGDPEEALRLAELVLTQRTRLLGEEHPEVRDSQTLLARALVAAKRYDQALPLVEQQYREQQEPADRNARRRSLAAWYLATTYQGLGRHAEAERLFREDMDGLLQATHEELNPPERHALRLLRQRYEGTRARGHEGT